MNKIIIDTREQFPYEFKHSKSFTKEVRKLDEGDYGLEVDGIIQPIIVERKSAGDLFGTLTKGHKRFINEIKRAKDKNLLMYVVVDAPYRSIYEGKFPNSFRSKVKGFVIAKICHSIELKYKIKFVFCQDRQESQRFIQDLFNSFIKHLAIYK